MNLFITVGTQLPFDRLISAVDQWAARRPDVRAFAQIGPGEYRPRSIEFAPFIDAGECRRRVQDAAVVIAHAGMGSILTALEVGKPIIVMPRRAALGEHRNDHQIATARSLLAQGRVIVAFDEAHLVEKLAMLGRIAASMCVSREASPALITAVRGFIRDGRTTIETAPDQTEALCPAHPDRSRDRATVDQRANKDERAAERTPTREGDWSGVAVLPAKRQAVRHTRRPDVPQRLQKLAAIVLLDGTVRRASFAQSIGRSILELPIDNERRVIDVWREGVLALRDALGLPRLRCRIVVSHNAQPPQLHPEDVAADLSIERDPIDLRGTGGVLHDLAAQYDDDATLLVANATQLLLRPLPEIARRLAAQDGDVTVRGMTDGTPTSFSLVSCHALRSLPPVGYIDFKEQAIGAIALQHQVTVLNEDGNDGLCLRTGVDYLDALHAFHAARRRRESETEDHTCGETDAFEEDWHSTFSVVEPGAAVAAGACLHDAVVLAGGCVDANGLVVRSVVCGNSRVARGQTVVDRLVNKVGEHAFDRSGR